MESQVIIKISITTVLVFIIYPIVRHVANKLISNAAKFHFYPESRAQTIKRALDVMIILVLITILISLWGIEPQNIVLALSSMFAVIGVALFAQWSILSNITAGIVVYFSLNFKTGDKIKILDKDFPLEATIIDMKTFYVFLETDEGEKIIYPNNLILQKGIAVCKKSEN